MTRTYTNRDGDVITFTENPLTREVEMSGYNPSWIRVGFANDENGNTTAATENEKIDMVDPSGGPYIKVGMDLDHFFNDGMQRVIEKIQLKDGKVIFTFKL